MSKDSDTSTPRCSSGSGSGPGQGNGPAPFPSPSPSPFAQAAQAARAPAARTVAQQSNNSYNSNNTSNPSVYTYGSSQQPRALKRSVAKNERHRSSSRQRFVLPSEQSQIPFEPSRTSVVSLATYQHMEDPRRYPRGDKNVVDRVITSLFGRLASSRSSWVHSARNRSLLGIPIMRPDSLIVHAWSAIITLVDLSYTAFLVPLSIAFDLTREGTSLSWLTISDICGTTFYLVDVVMEFHTGFVAAYDIRRQLVMRRGFVAENYMRRRGFVVDVICISALVPELVGALVPNASGDVFKILFFFRLLRLLRVARLLAGSSGVHFLVSPISGPILRVMNTATFFLINVLFTMLVFINLLGCMWWFTAEVEGLEDSWVAYAGVAFDVVNASSAAQYVTSVYFAMTVITTVGFGDITPQTVAEMLVAMLFMGIGLFYFGYIVSAVSSLVNMVNHQARGTQIVREKLEEIDVWASARHIPRNLRQEVKTYYLEVWAPHCGVRLDDADKFRELPAALRAELVLSLSGEALRRSYMLSALDMDMMEFLATLGLPFPLIAGHDLYMEGAPADKFWVLQEGELTVMRGITKIGVIVGPAVIGQAAIFSKLLDDCQNRMHTMRAAVNCTLWEFAAGPFSHMLRYRPKVLVRLCLRYRDHLMHLQRKFGKRAPRRVYRMIESLGTIAWAITNDEPFTGAEGREFHVRDPDAREASADDGLHGDDADRTDGGSPLREDKRSFASFNDFDDEPGTTSVIIAAAREFAGDPDWDDWEVDRGFTDLSPRRTEDFQDPSAAFPDPTFDRLETGLETMDPQPSGVIAFNSNHQHSQYDL